MTRRSARKRSEEVAALRQQVEDLTDAKAQLLDMLNIVILDAGGRVSVPLSRLEGHTRRRVHVDVYRPDPEQAGDSGRYVLTLEGYTPEPDHEVAVRLRAAGLWLPEGRA